MLRPINAQQKGPLWTSPGSIAASVEHGREQKPAILGFMNIKLTNGLAVAIIRLARCHSGTAAPTVRQMNRFGEAKAASGTALQALPLAAGQMVAFWQHPHHKSCLPPE